MHVLIIPSQRYVPEESPLSGIFQKDQAEALAASGHTVGVISSNLLPLKSFFAAAGRRGVGIKVACSDGVCCYERRGWNCNLPSGRMIDWFWLRVGMDLFERYAESRGMPDIVHAHNAILAGRLARNIRRRYGVPYLITEHSSDLARKRLSNNVFAVMKSAYAGAGTIVAVSRSLGGDLERQFGAAASPLAIVPNMLSKTFEAANLGEKTSEEEAFSFLAVGRLESVKGHASLVRAFKKGFEGRKVVLRIAGDGTLREPLKALVRELGIDKQVVFLGALERSEVLEELDACDAFVLASEYETFGVALIEALSRGKPVVATRCGGPAEIVDGSNGILVPALDVEELARGMGRMKQTADKYDGKAIRTKCLSKFGREAVVKRLSAIYLRMQRRSEST